MGAYNTPILRRGRSSLDTSKINLFNFDFKKRGSTSRKSNTAGRGATVESGVSTSEPDGVENAVTEREEVPTATTSSVQRHGQRRTSRKKGAENDKPLERNNGQERFPVSSNKKSNASNGQSGDEEMPFRITGEPDKYYKLKNAKVTRNLVYVNRSMAQNAASLLQPNFEEAVSNEEYPGVRKTVPLKLNASFKMGYLKIAPQTVKPPEYCDDAKLVFWVIKGPVTVKSAGGRSHAPNGDCLCGKELDAGACVVLPINTAFMFENWGTTEALLSYIVVQH